MLQSRKLFPVRFRCLILASVCFCEPLFAKTIPKVAHKQNRAVSLLSPSSFNNCDDFYRRSFLAKKSTGALAQLAKIIWPRKSEFETTEKFELRSYNFVKSRIGDLNSLYFSIYPADKFQYDADNRTMRLKITDVFSSVQIATWSNAKSFYQAENAFGRKVLVTKYTGHDLILDVSLPGMERYDLEFKMEPIDAALCKKNFGCSIQLLGKFEGIRSELEDLEPSVSDPTHIVTYKNIVSVKVRCALLVDGTGPVGNFRLDRFTLDF
jgi:hypothetical protein